MLKASMIIRRLNHDLSTRKSDFAGGEAGDVVLLTFGVSMTVRASDLHLESLHNSSRPHPFAAFLAPSPNLHGMSSQPPGTSECHSPEKPPYLVNNTNTDRCCNLTDSTDIVRHC